MTEETVQEEVKADEVPEVNTEEGVTTSAETPTSPQIQEEVVAEVVNIEQGGAQTVKAQTVTVVQGGIAHAEASHIEVKEGGIAVAMGEIVTVSEGGVFIAAADTVKMTDSMAVFVAASEISGENVKVIIDARAAAFFALIFGAVVGVIKFLLRRRE